MNASTPYRCTHRQAGDLARADIGIIGIGNPLMGDDGAGIAVIDRLEPLISPENSLFLYRLRHDLFEMADLLYTARRFILVDVFIGTPVGALSVFSRNHGAPMPSLHQTDIAAVMRMLEPLRLIEPFPSWEVRGIAVEPPFLLGAGLSDAVERAVDRLAGDLLSVINPRAS